MTEKSLIFRSDGAGFSLIELLMVVTIIGIIASIAVPNLLRSKAAANEAVAISYMRSWSAAQELYHTNHGCYADADNQLFDEGLIDGHTPADSHGYTFSLDNPPGSPGGEGHRQIFRERPEPGGFTLTKRAWCAGQRQVQRTAIPLRFDV